MIQMFKYVEPMSFTDEHREWVATLRATRAARLETWTHGKYLAVLEDLYSRLRDDTEMGAFLAGQVRRWPLEELDNLVMNLTALAVIGGCLVPPQQ